MPPGQILVFFSHRISEVTARTFSVDSVFDVGTLAAVPGVTIGSQELAQGVFSDWGVLLVSNMGQQ